MGATDDGSIPSRSRRRIAVSRVGGNGRDKDCVGHSPARAQPVRPGLRDRASPSRTEDGDHRTVRTRGDPASQGAALGSGSGAGTPRPDPSECGRAIIQCLAASQLTAAWASLELARLALLSLARPWPLDTTSQYRVQGPPTA